MLTDGSDSQADRRPEDDDPETTTSTMREPDHEIQLAEDVVQEVARLPGMSSRKPSETIGDRRQAGRRPLAP